MSNKKKTLIFAAFAALLFAGAGLAYAAYANYNACRCAQPSPGVDIPSICCYNEYAKSDGTIWGGTDGDTNCGCTSPKEWSSQRRACYTPCKNVTCSGSTPEKNPGISYNEDGTGCCQAATTVHKVQITATAYSAITSNNVYTYAIATPTSTCDTYTNLSNGSCASFLSNIKQALPPSCGSNHWNGGETCTPGSFTRCALNAPTINTVVSGASFLGICSLTGTDAGCNGGSYVPCNNGCSFTGGPYSGGNYTCYDGTNTYTGSAASAPAKCYVYQCMCQASSVNIADCV